MPRRSNETARALLGRSPRPSDGELECETVAGKNRDGSTLSGRGCPAGEGVPAPSTLRRLQISSSPNLIQRSSAERTRQPIRQMDEFLGLGKGLGSAGLADLGEQRQASIGPIP
jgi:hypothetical protein